MSSKISPRLGFLCTLTLLAALSRLLPHPPNFAPLAALALFGGAYFRNRWTAFAVPLLALCLSDMVINSLYYGEMRLFHPYFGWVYGSFALIVMLGFRLRRQIRWPLVVGSSVLASSLFFLITNFGFWLGSSLYPQTATGLLTCYLMGIPYFGNTLAGDLFYSGVLFGGFELAQRRFPALRMA